MKDSGGAWGVIKEAYGSEASCAATCCISRWSAMWRSCSWACCAASCWKYACKPRDCRCLLGSASRPSEEGNEIEERPGEDGTGLAAAWVGVLGLVAGGVVVAGSWVPKTKGGTAGGEKAAAAV